VADLAPGFAAPDFSPRAAARPAVSIQRLLPAVANASPALDADSPPGSAAPLAIALRI
jgi:hypothetical protein